MLDYAIIGSGVSGGRIAFELTRAGARCVLIEAGRELGPKTFPDNELDASTQLFWGGGLEVSVDGHLGFLRAKALGGTSIVNQALLDRFDDEAWDDWRARSGIGYLNSREMGAHYDACEEGLSVSEVPKERYNRNTKIFIEAFGKRGYGWKPLHRAQGDCALGHGSDCIVCLGGCPRNSKQSALITTIRWAREKGLDVQSEFEVDSIAYSADGTRVRGTQRGAARELEARRVVLAAGAFGNTAILLRSGMGPKLPALGRGFSCHPQFMTYAYFDDADPIDAHKGAFQAVKSDDRGLREAGFKLENVYAPPIATAMLFPGIGARHLRMMSRYRNYASMEVAVRDDAAGVISFSGGKIKIRKTMTAGDREKRENGLKLVKDLFEAAGAREIVQCRQSFGLHLMGGCVLGADPAKSVVSPEFEVHGHPGLYAADSSVFPGAPGINPSFTVMALSHRASQSIVKKG